MNKLLKRLIPEPVLVVLKLNLQHRQTIYGTPLAAVDNTATIWTTISKTYGHSRSVAEQRCVDAKGEPIPWYTYPSIEYLSSLDFSDCHVWEYGAGASTLWWAKRAKYVSSVDSDRSWFESVRQALPANCRILLRQERTEYIEAIQGEYDVVIVDGLAATGERYECCRSALSHLRTGGMIVLDNSDWLPLSCGLLRDSGLIQVDFNGFVPINDRPGRTSVFLSQPFAILYGAHRPTIAGVSQDWETGKCGLRHEVAVVGGSTAATTASSVR